MGERDGPAEQLLREHEPARERQRQQDEPRADEPEQEALEREQRHGAVRLRPRDAAVQPLLEPGQQQRLQRGDDEERIADERDGDVHGGPRFAGVREAMRRAAGQRTRARTAPRPAG